MRPLRRVVRGHALVSERFLHSGPRRLARASLDDFIADAGVDPNRIYDEDCGPTRPTFYVEKPSSRRDFLVRRFDLKHR